MDIPFNFPDGTQEALTQQEVTDMNNQITNIGINNIIIPMDVNNIQQVVWNFIDNNQGRN